MRAGNLSLNLSQTTPLKENYEYWPLFKQDNTPHNKAVKQKLYSHLVVSLWPCLFELFLCQQHLNS